MNGAMTLNLVRSHLKRFVTFPTDEAADLCTLWAVHSHCRDTSGRLALATSPRLMFLSKLPASGKTAAMERVISVCHNPRTVIDPTPLSLATLIDEGRPTIAFDEIDCAFGNGQAKQQVRSILNSGYKPGAEFSRGRGDPINIFAPIVMAGLSKRVLVEATLAALRSRAFIIEMEPGIPSEEYWEADHGALTANYRAMLALWCKRNLQTILAQRPITPGLEGRQKEIAYPLLQIAATAGGHWPGTAANAMRTILLGIVPEDAPDEMNLFEQLLTDLSTIYADADRMSTNDIVAGLYAQPGSPWQRVWPNRNKAPRELAQLLAPMGAESMTIRTAEGGTVKGYHREGLENLWNEVLSNDEDTFADTFADTIDLDDDELIDA